MPLDKAAVRREGADVTILGWLLMLHYSLQAAEQLAGEGIRAEVIDVRSLSPLDLQTIGASVRKTGRVVVVEEGPKTGSVSAEIAAGIMEHFGEYLRCPIRRVASADVPVPFTPVLENAYRPDVPRIVGGRARSHAVLTSGPCQGTGFRHIRPLDRGSNRDVEFSGRCQTLRRQRLRILRYNDGGTICLCLVYRAGNQERQSRRY